jgi:hypothetical protein
MNRKWILAGVLSFGMAGAYVAPVAFAKDAKVEEKEYDDVVRYKQLPKPVQEAVDKERGNHEVKAFYHVFRDGKEFYRAVIDLKGDDKIVRFKPGGELLSEAALRDRPAKEIVTRASNVKRDVRLHTDESDGEVVDFDRLPGGVKSEIGRLAKGSKVEEVVRYKHRGATMYRAEVGEGKYTRYIRVGEDGKLQGVRGDIDPGEVVKFDRLPGDVKSKIGSLAKGGKVDEVIEYKRGGTTYYQAEVDDRGSDKNVFVTVDASGRQVEGLPRI